MKKILSVIAIAAFLFACNNEEKKSESAATEVKTEAGKAPVELIMDSNFVNATKATMTAFENKDVEGYTANMADDVKFRWSGGDSLVGKQAVKDYYKGRFDIIDNIIKLTINNSGAIDLNSKDESMQIDSNNNDNDNDNDNDYNISDEDILIDA